MDLDSVRTGCDIDVSKAPELWLLGGKAAPPEHATALREVEAHNRQVLGGEVFECLGGIADYLARQPMSSLPSIYTPPDPAGGPDLVGLYQYQLDRALGILFTHGNPSELQELELIALFIRLRAAKRRRWLRGMAKQREEEITKLATKAAVTAITEEEDKRFIKAVKRPFVPKMSMSTALKALSLRSRGLNSGVSLLRLMRKTGYDSPPAIKWLDALIRERRAYKKGKYYYWSGAR